MSSITRSSASPLDRTTSASSRWSGVSSVPSSRPLIPITAFIGVRISWLIVARKALFARVAASASSRARWSSATKRALSIAVAANAANASAMRACSAV